jgi:YtoQ family protein
MSWQIYLAGEIHTDWRERIEHGATAAGLDLRFTAPVTNHAASDAAGTAILGEQETRSGTTTSVPASTPSARAR